MAHKSCALHDALVDGICTRYASVFCRDIVASYHLPCDGSAIFQTFREPKLQCESRGVMGNGYPDILAVIRSGGSIFTSVVEVKRTPRDLLTSGEQYAKYLGCTSTFFIAVPSSLLHVAITEIRYPFGLMTFKGILNADTGDIVVLPVVQPFDLRTYVSLLSGVCTSDIVLTTTVSDMSSDCYVEIDGMMVRRTYAPIAQSESIRRYPRDMYYDLYARWGGR